MKKIIFSLFFAALFIFGCTKFDEYGSENYGSGPTVEITVSSIRDSSFVVNIAPASGVKYYSYWIVASSSEVEIVAQNLLKTAYAGSVSVDATEKPSITVTYDKALPFTAYQIYAVASTDKGVIGEVSHGSVKTTDGETPVALDFDYDSKAPESLTVTFSEIVSRGEGTVSITLYKRWDLANPETIELDEESILVEGDVVTVLLPDSLPGIYFAVSWAAGAFVDAVNNPTPAENSGFNSSSGQFFGIYGRIPTVAFAVESENVVVESPFFSDWEAFEAELTFDFAIYPNAAAKNGAIKVVYSNAAKSTAFNFALANWTVAGQSLKFGLPEAPQLLDSIGFSISEGVFFDVYGNPNAAYAPSAAVWCYRNDYRKEDFIGNFLFTYGSQYEDPADIFDGGSLSIEENPDVENGVILKNFYLGEDAEDIEATYDITSGKLLIPDLSVIGLAEDEGTTYLLATYNMETNGPIEFVLNSDKTLVCASMFGIVAADPDTGDLLGYWDKLVNATFTPEAPAARLKSLKSVKRQSHGLNIEKISARKSMKR
ncbi:MAG: hypothetical protein LBD45_00210 [Bacteroidales bacterium]|jgi:hypothetical protein|nr:hypothetical protein [Bacteroidales bacterium]